jgi:hypothetical protein
MAWPGAVLSSDPAEFRHGVVPALGSREPLRQSAGPGHALHDPVTLAQRADIEAVALAGTIQRFIISSFHYFISLLHIRMK